MAEAGARPFFEAKGTPRPGARRLLLISYYFPPSQAAGALRWQKLAGHAAERGYRLDVITRPPGSVKHTDARSLEELPPGTRVFGVPDRAASPAQAVAAALGGLARAGRRLLTGGTSGNRGAHADGSGPASTRPTSLGREEIRWNPMDPRAPVRAFLALAHCRAEAAWARRATGMASRVCRDLSDDEARDAPSAVVTCGPPHMVHEAGRRLARELGVPLIADFRDPWSLQQRLPEPVASPVWYALARRYERRLVGAADLVVCNTEPFRRRMAEIHPEAGDRLITVLNGFDEGTIEPAPERDRFLIAYAGTLYLDRDPRPLLRAVRRVASELELGPAEIRIELIGNVHRFDGMSLERMAAEESVAELLSLRGYRPRREAMELLSRASLLVSLPQDADLAIPSKVFEYMRFPAWILALAQPGSATADVLRDSDADVLPEGDVEGIASVVRKRYLQFRAGELPRPIAETSGCGRDRQARILFDAIDARVGAAAGPFPAG